MIQKTIKYTDFDGNQVEETYYFHLTKGELLDWAAEGEDGFAGKIASIANEDDPIKILPMMKEVILRSYGVRTPDGKSFVKDPEIVKNFKYTQAFDELYVELSTDANKAAEFVNGILPVFDAETQAKLDEARAQYEKGLISEGK